MRKRFLKIMSVLAVAGSLGGPVANAQKTNSVNSPTDARAKPHVGVLLGVGDRVGEFGAGFNWGVDGGFEIYGPWSLGLQVHTFKSSTDIIGASLSVTRWSILPKVTYNFSGDTPIIKDSWAGLKLGPVFDKSEVVTVAGSSSDTVTRLAVAPAVGFDIPFMDNWSAGADLSYMFVFGPEDNNDSMNLLGSLKYWF